MKTPVCLCDLCIADSEITVATGTYSTAESRTFDACDDHLEEVKNYGFTTQKFTQPGGNHGLF